jgi:type VI secretion system secreted protein VgrG
VGGGGDADVRLLGEGLPADVLVVELNVEEALSELFTVTVRFSTEDGGFRGDALLRQRLAAVATDGSGRQRVFDGVVERARLVDVRGVRLEHELTLRPRLAALRWRQGCRIFQDLAVPDIVRSILKDAGIDDRVAWRLRKAYEPRVFCAQYREAELDFVRRLLEDEGIHFFFLHDEDGHTLVFADDTGAFGGDEEPLRLAALEGTSATGGKGGGAPLARISRKLALRRGLVHLRDHDPEQPAVPPESVASAPAPFALAAYAYPGGFTDGEAAKRKAQARLDADRADADVVRGVTYAVGTTPGLHVIIEGSPDELFEGTFAVTRLVTEAKRRATQAEGRKVGDVDRLAITTSFEGVPEKAAHAPTRRTPRPRIRGLQTARVTGSSHEEQAIHVDHLGRVKVRFLWDRAGTNDDTTSCWLRVSQVHLGGSMVHPRVGWEVAVAFLDGDPDRPHVVGRLYDGEHQPPRALPAAAAETSIQSMVTPGAAGMNAIHLGDGAGGQTFAIKAQKDMNTVVGDCRKESITGNETIAIGVNASLDVTGDDLQTIGGDQSVDVGNAAQVKVGAAQTITIGGGETVGTVGDMNEKGTTRAESIGGSRTTISNGVREGVTGALTRDVGSVQVHLAAAGVIDECEATYDESASAVIVHLVGGTHAETVGGAKTLESTAAELHLASSYAQSASSVTQLVGAARVRLVSGDVVFAAPTILVGGGAGHFMAGGSSIKLNGGPVTVKASAIKLDAPLVNKSGGSLKLG